MSSLAAEVVEEFDDDYWSVFRTYERDVREALTDGAPARVRGPMKVLADHCGGTSRELS